LVIDYSKGMSEYCRLNNDKNNFIKMKKDITDEIIECYNEIQNFRFKNAFLEFLDIYHCFIKFILLLFMPLPYYENIWKIVAIFIPFYNIQKHGLRYKKTKCIRSSSHHIIKDHICYYKQS
jgi:hypothetical protein